MRQVEVHEHLYLGPSVDGLHRTVVRRSACTGHRVRDTILRKKLVEALRGIDGSLVGVQDQPKPINSSFLFQDHLQALVVSVRIAAPLREPVSDDLVVPEVHVEGQLPIRPVRPERGHVRYDALHRPIRLKRGHHQVRERLPCLSRRLVGEVLRLGLYPGESAASVGVLVGHDEAGVEPYLGVEPTVSVARVFGVVFLEQHDIGHPFLDPWAGVRQPRLPFVEPGPRYRHLAA